MPSAFPKITRIKATSSSIDLEWDAIPKDAENGRLLGYNVYYVKHTDVADFLNKYKQLYVNISSRQATITGLKSYTIYHVGVAAFNSKGFAHQLVTISQVNTFRTKEGGRLFLHHVVPVDSFLLVSAFVSSVFVYIRKPISLSIHNASYVSAHGRSTIFSLFVIPVASSVLSILLHSFSF